MTRAHREVKVPGPGLGPGRPAVQASTLLRGSVFCFPPPHSLVVGQCLPQTVLELYKHTHQYIYIYIYIYNIYCILIIYYLFIKYFIFYFKCYIYIYIYIFFLFYICNLVAWFCTRVTLGYLATPQCLLLVLTQSAAA